MVTVSDLKPDVGDVVVQPDASRMESISYHYVENSDFFDLGIFWNKKEGVDPAVVFMSTLLV